MIAMMLEDYVEALGHHVWGQAASVDEALEKAGRGGFDLAILDCHLNGEPVWPVAERLERDGVPFILSSGGLATELPAEHAARPMLEKPYTIAMISDVFAAVEAARG